MFASQISGLIRLCFHWRRLTLGEFLSEHFAVFHLVLCGMFILIWMLWISLHLLSWTSCAMKIDLGIIEISELSYVFWKPSGCPITSTLFTRVIIGTTHSSSPKRFVSALIHILRFWLVFPFTFVCQLPPMCYLDFVYFNIAASYYSNCIPSTLLKSSYIACLVWPKFMSSAHWDYYAGQNWYCYRNMDVVDLGAVLLLLGWDNSSFLPIPYFGFIS